MLGGQLFSTISKEALHRMGLGLRARILNLAEFKPYRKHPRLLRRPAIDIIQYLKSQKSDGFLSKVPSVIQVDHHLL